MQLLGMQTSASTHPLLCQSAALIELIGMCFNLNLNRLLPKNIMGVVIRPGQEFSSGSLPPLKHVA